MSKKIGIGFIGTGFARKTQIPAFAVVEGAELISVSSGQVENAKSTAEEWGIAHFSDDWRTTVEHPDVDLVCITTPPSTHFEMTMHAIECGKHVLCEKPMAMNADEARQMNNLAKEKGVMALIDHELRLTNGRKKAYTMIRNGEIGEIFHAKYFFNNGMRGSADLAWNWWSSFESGGGALGAIGSHVIDTFQWFLDAEITDVFCQLKTNVAQRPHFDTGLMAKVTTDDETLMILNFADSELIKNGSAIVSLSVVESGNYRNAVEFFGKKGAIRIEDGGEIFFADNKENKWREIEFDLGEVAPKMQSGGWSRGFYNIAHEIIAALRNGNIEVSDGATFADGLAIQKVLDAAHESNRSKKAIKI